MELHHTILIEIATLYTYYATKLRIIFESTKKKANFCALQHIQHSILALLFGGFRPPILQSQADMLNVFYFPF